MRTKNYACPDDYSAERPWPLRRTDLDYETKPMSSAESDSRPHRDGFLRALFEFIFNFNRNEYAEF
jgi:hypothetical protein